MREIEIQTTEGPVTFYQHPTCYAAFAKDGDFFRTNPGRKDKEPGVIKIGKNNAPYPGVRMKSRETGEWVTKPLARAVREAVDGVIFHRSIGVHHPPGVAKDCVHYDKTRYYHWVEHGRESRENQLMDRMLAATF